VYDDTAGIKPTLLASGYKEYKVEGDGTITIQMWPLVIDTKIQSNSITYNPTRGVATDVFQGVPGKIEWKIGKNEDGSGNGVEALIAAGGMDKPMVYIYSGETPASSGLSIVPSFSNELPILDTLEDIGTIYRTYFNIEYVPFSKSSQPSWAEFSSDYFDFTLAAPKWILRNGLNDDLQNTDTDFEKVGKPGGGYNYKDYNGNGGIPLKVKETLGFTDDDGDGVPDDVDDTSPAGGGDGSPEGPGNSDQSKYLLYAGKFYGKNGTTANISFSTLGYNGDAQVYSLVTAKDAYSKNNWPPYNLFTPYGDYAAGIHGTSSTPKTLTDPLIGTGGDVDIWLVFIKDGKVSNRIRINTGSGSIGVIPFWPASVDFSNVIIIPGGGTLTDANFTPISISEYYSDTPVWEESANGIDWTQIYEHHSFDRNNNFYRVTVSLNARTSAQWGFDDGYIGYSGSIGNNIDYMVYYIDYTQMEVVYAFAKAGP
jgi:hypothetical protein